MRVASKFSDYYDSGMAMGQDQSLIYNRYHIVEKLDPYPFSMINTYGLYPLSIVPYTIGFCGKLYRLLELNNSNSGSQKEIRSARKIAYSLEDVDNYILQNYPKEYERYSSSRVWTRTARFLDYKRGMFENYFNALRQNVYSSPTKEHNKEWVSSLFKHSSPIFLAETDPRKETGKITYNAELKPFEFYRVFDSYTAYQEVAMWLSNQAVPIKPIPKISDKIMIEIKGFDKFSFRKAPSKNRRTI